MPKTLLVFVAGILEGGFELESWWGFELPLTAHLEENGLPMQHRGDKKPNTNDKEDVQNSIWRDHGGHGGEIATNISMMAPGTIIIIILMKTIAKENEYPELCLIGVTLSQSRVSEKAIIIMTKAITQDKEDVQHSVWCDHVAGLAWRMSSTKAFHPG